MEKTSEDFKTAVAKKNIQFWPIHNCSICEYPCGYVFKDDQVFYDNGCYCTYGQNLNPQDWGDVARQYNMQTNLLHIEEMNKFFGFENEESAK